MSIQQLEAYPVQEVVCKQTGVFLGWVYLWNTGEYGTLWQGPKFHGEVEYRTVAGQTKPRTSNKTSPGTA